MITPKMIEAGKAAYRGHFKEDPYRKTEDCFTNQIVAIYEAMCEANAASVDFDEANSFMG